jgi:hypothetical protein
MQYFQKHGGIDKGEYWILDVAVECAQYISSLRHEEEYLEQAFNRKGHGLTYLEILDTLDSLFQRGDIIASFHSNDITLYSTEPFLPTREQIDLAMKEELPCSVFYELTPQGGARWESISQTNWNYFFDFVWPEEANEDREHDGLLLDSGQGFFYTKSDSFKNEAFNYLYSQWRRNMNSKWYTNPTTP